MRRVRGQERVRGDDAADVAEANLPRRPDRSTMVPAEVEIEPADDDRKGRIGAHGDEEQRRVLEVRPRVHGQQDGEAGDGHGDRHEREEEAVSEPVGEEGDDEGEDEGTGPRRDAVQLGPDLRVAVRADDAGGKEGVAVGRDDESEVHEAAQEEFVVFEAVEDVSEGDAAFAGRAALVLFESGLDVGAFVLLEPADGWGVNGHDSNVRGWEWRCHYHFASSGKSGIRKYRANEMMHVRVPSVLRSVECFSAGRGVKEVYQG